MSQTLPFVKMHGAGNDFVMVDGRDLDASGLVLDGGRVARLCHRQTGVGADGLIVVATDPDHDFRMRYWNSDGGEASMCGNGARCAFAFARSIGLVAEAGTFRTEAGPVAGRIEGLDVAVELTRPRDVALDVLADGEHPFGALHRADTGVPHLVIPVPSLEEVDLNRWGPALRNDPAFAPGGVNVDWVQKRADGAWLIRTYERGVEAETLACGTGAAAAGLILVRLGEAASPVTMLTRGGDRLRIGVREVDGEPALELVGPAVRSFQGEVNLDD